jgi:hypothetical protein
MSGNELGQIAPPAGAYGADGMRTNMAPNLGGIFGNLMGMRQTPGPGMVNPANISAQFGESDPMGMLPQQPKIDPALLQMMMSMRGMGGMGGAGGQGSPMAQGMPAPQIQPGALMGAMPQMPQGGFRPRGMAGRF